MDFIRRKTLLLETWSYSFPQALFQCQSEPEVKPAELSGRQQGREDHSG